MVKKVKLDCNDLELAGFIDEGHDTLEKLREYTKYQVSTLKTKINRLKRAKAVNEDEGVYYLDRDYLPSNFHSTSDIVFDFGVCEFAIAVNDALSEANCNKLDTAQLRQLFEDDPVKAFQMCSTCLHAECFQTKFSAGNKTVIG